MTTDWKKLIPGGFAGMEAPFGVHPNDHERAERMFHHALCQGATMKEIIKEAEKHLATQGCAKGHISYQVNLIKSFKKNPYYKKNFGKAWLITWEGTSVDEDITKRIVSIQNSRLSSDKIKKYMEQFYIDHSYSLFEKLTYKNNKKNNPYKAEYIKIDGHSWQGRITCGHNPFLLGRLVSNLRYLEDKNGNEYVTLDEMPIPKRLPPLRNSTKQAASQGFGPLRGPHP